MHFEEILTERLDERPNFHEIVHNGHPICKCNHIRATSDEETPQVGRQTLRKCPKKAKTSDLGPFRAKKKAQQRTYDEIPTNF